MSRHGGRKNGVPDRWLDYRAVGKRLPGTRFVAFKVPLKQSLNCQLSRSDVFGPWELLDALNKEKQELGLIIDLTFTSRYYKVQDVPQSLLFVKIFTAGHEVPSDDTILSFKRAVRRFLRDNGDNELKLSSRRTLMGHVSFTDKLIGVHCTHGLNRTGYLICRYLIDVDGMDPKEAVQLFNSSRGHAIERENYLDDLQRGPRRSNDGMEESEQEPMRGHAARRPSDSDRREERRPHYNDSRHHRYSPPRRTNHRSHHHGLLPSPPLQHLPPFCPPMRAPLRHDHHPYRWTAPHADGHWRRPSHSEESRSRYPPAERDWSPSSRRRRAPPPPPPPAPPPLPRYSVRWTNESNGIRDGHDEEWAGRPMRSHHRFRVDTYDNY